MPIPPGHYTIGPGDGTLTVRTGKSGAASKAGHNLVIEVTSWHVPVLAVCVALGMVAHVAGDMLTHDGCPLLYPLSRYEFGLLPEPVRITTNKLAERWVISPLLLIGLAYFIYRDAAPALTTAASGGWP